MSVIAKALDEVKFRIPRPILERVFINQGDRWRQTPASIDEAIMATVVRPRVLIDCQLLGGVEAFIPLGNLTYERPDEFTCVYRIPKKMTQGRSIVSVMNITFTDPTRAISYNDGAYGGSVNTGSSTMLRMGQSVMDAMGSIPLASTAKVHLIGENVVMVRDTVLLPNTCYLRCTLADDDQMSHIQLRSYRAFSRLVELAVKSYIYIHYVIPMDMGELHGGANIGRFKEMVDSYSDSEELYQTYLIEKWEKIAVMNDHEGWSRLLRMQIGGAL